MTVKAKVLSAIQRLPEDVDFKVVSEEVAVLAAIQDASDPWAGWMSVSGDQDWPWLVLRVETTCWPRLP